MTKCTILSLLKNILSCNEKLVWIFFAKSTNFNYFFKKMKLPPSPARPREGGSSAGEGGSRAGGGG